MTNFGLKYSVRGDNVFSTDNLDLSFSSKFTTLKVYDKSNVSFTTNGAGDGNVDFSHGLGYAPSFFVFRKGTASWQKLGSPDASTYPNAYFPDPGNPHTWIANHREGDVYSTPSIVRVRTDGAAAGTTYNFLRYTLADLVEEFDDISQEGDQSAGMKIAHPGVDVRENQDFNLGFSSRYRALRYNPTKSGTTTMSLPIIFGSAISDPTPEEATYVDILHGQGYPPFFMAYFKSNLYAPLIARQVPFSSWTSTNFNTFYIVDSWCDATRIRFTFWRKAYYAESESHAAETITIKYLIFDEDLTDVT